MVPFWFEPEGAPSSAPWLVPVPTPSPVSFQTTSSASTPTLLLLNF